MKFAVYLALIAVSGAVSLEKAEGKKQPRAPRDDKRVEMEALIEREERRRAPRNA